MSDVDDLSDDVADDEFLAPLLKAFSEVEARLTEISEFYNVSLTISTEQDSSERAPSTARSIRPDGDIGFPVTDEDEGGVERGSRRPSRVVTGGDKHPPSKGPTANMRKVPRAIKAHDTTTQDEEQPAPRAVIQLGDSQITANAEGDRPRSKVKGEKHIHGPVKPANCSDEDWQRETERRRRQAEHDRQEAAQRVRLTPAGPAADVDDNAVRLSPVNPAIAAARANAAERVERRERNATGRGKGDTSRPTPYWRARDSKGKS